MIIVSPTQLEKIFQDKVKLRLKQYEEEMKSSQQLEMRVKHLEDSLTNLSNAGSVQF